MRQKLNIKPYLGLMIDKHASDLYLSSYAPINIKVEGVTSRLDSTYLTPEMIEEVAYALMSDEQRAEFEENLELDIAISYEKLGRFRVNVFRQRGDVAMVIRYITAKIRSIESLHLPSIMRTLVMEPRGLILVVGTTGSGKSTTLASMINYRSQNKTGHILTIEDPIEYIQHHARSIVNQREVGIDTKSYASALRRAMREAPDVIMIGEIRDRETMQAALAYADTGHLCLSTLHATNANQALDRIVNFFPETAHHQLFTDLSMNLRSIISQRLVIGKDKKRLPAIEVLLNTPHIEDLIRKGHINEVRDAMEQSSTIGMQTFDQALFDLYKEGSITADEALFHAESRNNLQLRMRLTEQGDITEEDFSLQE